MKRTAIALAGPWSFRLLEGPGGAGGAPPQSACVSWMPATVPGTVHTDLFANGKIGDPFYATNEREQQWIGEQGWEYRTTFAVDDALFARAHVDLVSEGLDTFADVFLNGVRVLASDNMFRRWRAPLKAALARGTNELLVRFRSPLAEVRPAHDALGYVLPATNDQASPMLSVFARKAPYHYGWDWGPRFVTSGIWRPLRIEAWDLARIEALQVTTVALTEAVAVVHVSAEVVAAGRVGGARATIEVGGTQVTVEAVLEAGTTLLAGELAIAAPVRWWPNGLGEAHLYPLNVELAVDGACCDAAQARVGLRELEVEHREDAGGKSFTVRVNGAPVFMKGANYVPPDSFITRVDDERCRWLLQSAADANMNMVRVWGGGVYESDRFYELCDELGLLVWQDFMFACSMYPGNDAFVENVRLEAIDNVKRLRNHPCLALWAGNNEIEVAWARWGWPAKHQLSAAAQATMWNDCRHLFHQVLPRVVAEHDPGRFYTRSSPSANDDRVIPDTLGFGDMHYWGVWHAELPYEKYGENVSRFMSEYGFQSFPELDTVARYAPPSERRIDSPVMLAHQRHPRGNELIRIYMDRDFPPPRDFASFLYVSQVLQATVIRYAAEAHRRRMPFNWGSLYWQLDDCWPVASWSSIDYFGRWKALHYFARRFFAPILLSIVEEGGAVSVFVVSDRREDSTLTLELCLLDFAGRTLWRRTSDVLARANASQAHWAAPVAELLGGADPRAVVLVADALERGERAGRSFHYLVKTKDLALVPPEISLRAEARPEGGALVTVRSRALARSVRLTARAAAGHFADNYFDMLPGEAVTVAWTGSADADFCASSLWDAFARA